MSEERGEPRNETPLSPTNMLESPPLSTFAYSAPAYVHLPSIISSDLKARRNAMTNYKDLKKQFVERGVTYHRQLFLRNVAARLKFTTAFEVLFKWLNTVANELLMEELEVALWGLYLEQMAPSDLTYGENSLLWLVAFAAKQYFNTEARLFETVCNSQVKGFTRLFEEWRAATGMIVDVNLVDLNSTVANLSKPRTCPARSQGRDYNCLVNELLTVPEHKAKESSEEAPDSPVS